MIETSSSSSQKKSSITTPQSTISRLESKYSDILDRVAKRKQRQQQEQREAEDRDKTLEPDYSSSRSSGLMKSQTTANIMSKTTSSNNKERTPFRLERNKNKYISSELNNNDSSTVKLKRSDIIGVSGGSNSSSDSYTKMKSNDSGYYDSYKTNHSNYGKSMYDPDILMSDFSTRSSKKTPQPYTGSSTSRQIRPYKRTESGNIDKRRTTVVNLHEMLSDEDSEIENRGRKHQNLYTQRKSSGQYQQMMSDSRQKKRGEVEEPVTSSSSDLDEFDKTERENRRKEIQNLIKKYAQMDDFYGRSTAYSNAELDSSSSDTNYHSRHDSGSGRTSIKKESKSRIDPWDSKNKISPVRIPQKKSNPLGKSQTMANMSSLSSLQYNDDDNNNNGYSSWYMSNYHTNHSNNVVPIKTNVARSSTKSRMSKALSTFVRI